MNNKIISTVGLFGLLGILSGCGNAGAGFAMHGAQQSVRVDVYPHTKSSVSCVLQNERGAYTADDVPQHVQVERAYGPLSVKCHSMDGQSGSTLVSSSAEALGVLGSIVAGPISIGQDVKSGAAFGYPATVVVRMGAPLYSTVADAQVSPIENVTAPVSVAAPLEKKQTHVVRHTAHRIILSK